MNWQHYWKSIMAFLGAVLTNVATRLIINGEPWPTNVRDGLAFAGTTALSTWLVYQKANAPAEGRHAKTE